MNYIGVQKVNEQSIYLLSCKLPVIEDNCCNFSKVGTLIF